MVQVFFLPSIVTLPPTLNNNLYPTHDKKTMVSFYRARRKGVIFSRLKLKQMKSYWRGYINASFLFKKEDVIMVLLLPETNLLYFSSWKEKDNIFFLLDWSWCKWNSLLTWKKLTRNYIIIYFSISNIFVPNQGNHLNHKRWGWMINTVVDLWNKMLFRLSRSCILHYHER